MKKTFEQAYDAVADNQEALTPKVEELAKLLIAHGRFQETMKNLEMSLDATLDDEGVSDVIRGHFMYAFICGVLIGQEMERSER